MTPAPETAGRPDVSVVVTHYEAPEQLALVLAGLAGQTLAADRFEVVVADDGSAVPPTVPSLPFVARVVAQADEGFRAAAARNLGAAATTGRLLCFLDGDTVPEPGYLAALLRTADRLGDCLLVGRRRHAELAGWDPARLTGWLQGRGPAPVELPEPTWLQDGYRWTDDLRAADDESYRFVISAVLAVRRGVFERAGGFDERFTRYGGEDWELANRCWLAGAEFRFVPDAVAWHDGVEFAGREVDRRAVQTEQALTLARLLPSPATRPVGPVWQYPQVVVEVDDRGWAAAEALLCVSSLLAGGDVGVWLRDGSLTRDDGPLGADPRVRTGAVPTDATRRCRYRVRVDQPVELAEPLPLLLERAPLDRPGLRLRHARRLAQHGWDDVTDLAPGDAVTREVDARAGLGSILRTRDEASAPSA